MKKPKEINPRKVASMSTRLQSQLDREFGKDDDGTSRVTVCVTDRTRYSRLIMLPVRHTGLCESTADFLQEARTSVDNLHTATEYASLALTHAENAVRERDQLLLLAELAKGAWPRLPIHVATQYGIPKGDYERVCRPQGLESLNMNDAQLSLKQVTDYLTRCKREFAAWARKTKQKIVEIQITYQSRVLAVYARVHRSADEIARIKAFQKSTANVTEVIRSWARKNKFELSDYLRAKLATEIDDLIRAAIRNAKVELRKKKK